MEKLVNDFSIGLFLWQLMLLLIVVSFVIAVVFLVGKLVKANKR